MYFFYYVPVGLDAEAKRRPAMTIFMALSCVIVFFIYRYKPISAWWDLSRLIFQPEYPSLATAFAHVFLHGGYFHLIGNLVYLVLFGRALEDRLGPVRFYAVFALSAAAGVYTHLVLTTALSPEYLPYGVIGASGATSGLLGAYIVRLHYARVRIAYWVFLPLQGVNRAGRTYLPVIFAVLLWFLLQGVRTVMQFGVQGMQVAYSVHIGGFLAGVALALLFGARGASRAEEHLVRARRHFEEAAWFPAQCEYMNYLSLREGDAGAHAEAARTFLCTGERSKAQSLYERAITLGLERSERDAAEAIFAEAMRNLPPFVMPERMHLDLACGMERTLKFNAALQAYERFLEGHPASREAPFVLMRIAGLRERRFDEPLEALRVYRRLLEEHPADAWADLAGAEARRLAWADSD